VNNATFKGETRNPRQNGKSVASLEPLKATLANQQQQEKLSDMPKTHRK